MNCNNYFDMTDQGDSFETWQGLCGPAGTTFTPAVSSAGVISWTNNGGLPNPESVNIKGPQGEIGPQGPKGDKGDKGDPGEVTQAEFDALADEVADQKSAIEALDSLVDRKAGMLVDTASGAIASFVPDSTVPNLLGVTVDVEPVQDLHGYENPWPAGGGKNKFAIPRGLPITSKGITLFYDGYHYVVTGTATGTVRTQDLALDLAVGVYILSANQTSDKTRVVLYKNGTLISSQAKNDAAYSFNVESGDVITCGLQILSSAENCTIEPQIESGSTATTYAPYSNICPISGWDAVEVERTGVNAWDEQWVNGRWAGNNGAFNPAFSYYVASKNAIPVKPNTTYYFCIDSTLSSAREIVFYDADDNWISDANSFYQNATFTTPNNAYFVRFNLGVAYGTTYNNDISINYPSTDHAYHPYAGNRYIIQLGQTVYGGTLDVTNGKLYVFPHFDSYNGEALVGPWLSSMDVYAEGATPTIGAEVVDMGGTPTVYDIDPVQIAAIANQTNNVWADAGDVDVTYAADLKTYIDQKIAAAVAALS